MNSSTGVQEWIQIHSPSVKESVPAVQMLSSISRKAISSLTKLSWSCEWISTRWESTSEHALAAAKCVNFCSELNQRHPISMKFQSSHPSGHAVELVLTEAEEEWQPTTKIGSRHTYDSFLSITNLYHQATITGELLETSYFYCAWSKINAKETKYMR